MKRITTPEQNRFVRHCIAIAALSVLAACGGSAEDAAPAPTPPTLPASITAQPTSQIASAGGSVSFAASATGDSLRFQWQRSIDGGTTWADVSGGTSATLTLGTLTSDLDGNKYRVVVIGAANTVTSSAVTLNVGAVAAAPTVASQPVGATVAAGQAANFSVFATGTGVLSYQWQRDGVNIAGANGSSYSLASAAATDSGVTFRVVVSNSVGSVTSSVAVLSVADSAVPAPTIAAQPQSLTGTDGGPILLSVAAQGTGPFSYQWRKNGVAIVGATDSTYGESAVVKADSGTVYSVVVTNGGGSVVSSNATLTVNYLAADWLAQPSAASTAQGQTALFVAAASGSQPITYQWLRNGTAITGATGASYTTPATALGDDGGLYSVVATGPANSITSTPARLTVVGAAVAPNIAVAPASLTISEGQLAAFSATAGGTGPLAYQWLKNGVAIAGATAASYSTPATTIADNAARFSVKVSNAAGSATSSEAVLTVQAATGGLVGRAWAIGQLLDLTDNEVLTRDRVIDDSGRVTEMYMQYNGSRWQLFAKRGTPGAAGTPPAWTAPVALDVQGVNAVYSGSRYNYFFGLSGSPNGNAVAYWTFDKPCTRASYRTVAGTRQFIYTARLLAATGTWEAPVSPGSFPGSPSSVNINDRGDISFVATGGEPATGYPYYTERPAVAWRAVGESDFLRQFLIGPISKYSMDMDANGNMLVAGQLTQNATTDAAFYRGTMTTMTAAFGDAEVLDTRGAAVSSVTPTVGVNGQQIVTWIQNNGTRSSVYAATSATPSGSFAVRDLGITGWDYIHALDNGQIALVDYSNLRRYRWTAGTWADAETIPNWRAGYTSPSNSCTVARNGNGLCASGGNGQWSSYDATRNVVVQAVNTASPGPGYVLGFNKGLGWGSPILSTGGFGFTDALVSLDVLPTPALPAGDGRNVVNLWGFYFK